jgi:hypothetical protein
MAPDPLTQNLMGIGGLHAHTRAMPDVRHFHRFTSATMDAISSSSPHSISLDTSASASPRLGPYFWRPAVETAQY